MQFKNLADMEKYLTALVQTQIATTDEVRSVVAKTVSEKVESEVYDKYSPQHYKRRGANGGLADEHNVEVTSVQKTGNTVQIILENTTMGADTLVDEIITDTIEEGIKENWANSTGVWANSRPFIEPAIEELKGSSQLRSAVENSLRKSGLQVK